MRALANVAEDREYHSHIHQGAGRLLILAQPHQRACGFVAGGVAMLSSLLFSEDPYVMEQASRLAAGAELN